MAEIKTIDNKKNKLVNDTLMNGERTRVTARDVLKFIANCYSDVINNDLAYED